MKKHLSFFLIVALAFLGAARAADAPQSVNYQGKLLNSSGATVADGSYTILFKIYGAASGSTLLWGESATVVVSSGTFNIVLGQGSGSPIAGATYSAIGDALSFTTTPYLGLTITVDSSGAVSNPQEIAPRLLFLSSAFALVAHNSHNADFATTATNALTLNGQSASAYYTPATTAATTFQGPITMANTTTVTSGGTFTVSGTTTLSGQVNLNGTVAFGTAGTTGGGFVPVGGIIMWTGSTAPAGWGLCDGTQGTPDLRNRFIIGSGSSYANGNTGGATSTALTASMIPDHKHQYKDTIFAENSIGVGSGSGPENIGNGTDGSNNNAGSKSGWDSDNSLSWIWRTTLYTRSNTTSPASSNDAVPIMPPYYALAYIERLK